MFFKKIQVQFKFNSSSIRGEIHRVQEPFSFPENRADIWHTFPVYYAGWWSVSTCFIGKGASNKTYNQPIAGQRRLPFPSSLEKITQTKSLPEERKKIPQKTYLQCRTVMGFGGRRVHAAEIAMFPQQLLLASGHCVTLPTIGQEIELCGGSCCCGGGGVAPSAGGALSERETNLEVEADRYEQRNGVEADKVEDKEGGVVLAIQPVCALLGGFGETVVVDGPDDGETEPRAGVQNGDEPADGNDFLGPFDGAHFLREQGLADADVAFHGEAENAAKRNCPIFNFLILQNLEFSSFYFSST